MSLISSPHISSITLPKTFTRHQTNHHPTFSLHRNHHHHYPHLYLSSASRILSSSEPLSQYDDDEEPDRKPKPESVISDEWSEKTGSETEPQTRFSVPDPPVRDDEWDSETEPEPEKETETETGTGTGAEVEIEDKNLDLKRCLVDTVYGSGLGFGASSEIRAEVTELINQLEAVNPILNPTEVPELLNGNWVLVYTASSELLPLLAVGSTPLLKVERVSQNIDTGSSIVENSTTLSTPFATFTFSATAGFDVRSPSRIQVQFKEATFKPPEIKSQFGLPESVDIFGQKITLSPVQQLLNPVQQAAATISGSLYGLPPLKVPIPGERSSSWLITTYLDDDFRISRGDGGLFVLVREGSPLLDQ